MVAGHLQEKKGYYYIVLNYQDLESNRKVKWIPTNLPVKGNKKRAEQMLWEAREKFKPPVERGSMHTDMPFTEYLEEWLKEMEVNLLLGLGIQKLKLEIIT